MNLPCLVQAHERTHAHLGKLDQQSMRLGLVLGLVLLEGRPDTLSTQAFECSRTRTLTSAGTFTSAGALKCIWLCLFSPLMLCSHIMQNFSLCLSQEGVFNSLVAILLYVCACMCLCLVYIYQPDLTLSLSSLLLFSVSGRYGGCCGYVLQAVLPGLSTWARIQS